MREGCEMRMIALRGSLMLFPLLAVLFGPLTGEAQVTGRIYRACVLIYGGPGPSPTGPNPGLPEFDAFIRQLRELGHVPGQNLIIDTRGAEGKFDRLPRLVAELIALKADVIFAPATPAVRAVKNATSSIPMVMALAPSPVEDGLVASLGRPGGNVTGLSSTSFDLSAKRLQLVTEVVSKVTRTAVLGNPDSSVSLAQMNATLAGCGKLRADE